MTFLLECPICGPRDVYEFKFQGEVTKRPTRTRRSDELSAYVYFRDNVAGVQREWWYHRIGCGLWFLADRDTRTNEVLGTSSPPRPDRRPHEALAAAGRADRPRVRGQLSLRGEPGPGVRRRHDRLGSLRGRSPHLLAQLQVPPPPRPALLLRALRELHDDGRRRAQRARVRGAGAGGRRRARPERGRLRRPRPAQRGRSCRRAVHAGRLLLPHDDPAAPGLAAVRAPPPPRRRPRPRAGARRSAQIRHRARASRRARDRRRPLGQGDRGRRRPSQAAVSSSSTSAAATRPPGTRCLRLRARSGSTREGSFRWTPARCSSGCAPGGSSSPPDRSSSRSSFPVTTSSESCCQTAFAVWSGISPSGRG